VKVRPEYDKAGNIIRWCVDAGVAAGKRIRKRFTTKVEADLWAKENKSIKRTESVKTLSLWADLTESERGGLIRALEILRPALTQINFEEIAQCYLTFAKPSGGKHKNESRNRAVPRCPLTDLYPLRPKFIRSNANYKIVELTTCSPRLKRSYSIKLIKLQLRLSRLKADAWAKSSL
jgi:hypothetical protein